MHNPTFVTALMTLAVASNVTESSTLRANEVPRPTAATLETEVRSELAEVQLLAFAKGFCVAMRRNHKEASVPELRKYVDPRYLETHGLADGKFKLAMAAVGAIRNIQVADDRRTILCQVETGDERTEAILLRVDILDGELYLLPLEPPHAETGVVKPWILRMEF